MVLKVLIQLMFASLTFTVIYGQVNGITEPGDPTNQELALLDWTSGIRVFYCPGEPLGLLVEPFKRALVRSLNKFCKNATACGLVKSVPFTPDHVVLLDGYPRLDYGAVQFRFVVVLPPNAVPTDRHLKQPLLTKEILADFLRTSIKEFERRFGWKVSSYERFPKFDPITEFMNTALIPIGFLLLALMFFLAYWSAAISRSTGGGDGWFVSGSSGGKNTAVKRTLEIIEEQKAMEAEKDREKQHRLRAQRLYSQSDIVLEIEPSAVAGGRGGGGGLGAGRKERRESDKFVDISRSGMDMVPTLPSLPSTAQSESSVLEDLPETGYQALVPIISQSSTAGSRFTGGRRQSRRLSSIDDGSYNVKRHRKFRANASARRRPKRQWKSTSMALGGFGKS